MKKIYLLFLLGMMNFLSGQNNSSTNNHIPLVIPPSPTVASLMKFEEIKVSEYTGIPNISIPLYTARGIHNFSLNVSMNYHPANIKKGDISGYTGLGWSLFAGGSISRTVMDIPDEYNQRGSSENGLIKKKLGIYSDLNNFYTVLPLLNDDNHEINKFLFESNEKQSFDTKHDLYQYNFMGYSGKFIIIKTGDTYNVKKLAKDNLIINYISNNQTFEIIDEKGFKYIFDIKELSNTYSTIVNYSVRGNLSDSYNNPYVTDYVSSFHLSKIYYKQDEIAEISYNKDDELLVEEQITKNESNYWNTAPGYFNEISNYIHSCPNLDNMLPPKTSFSDSRITTKTKKIKKIELKNSVIIEFENLLGKRLDVNINANSPLLNKIIIKNLNNDIIKSYSFEYNFYHKLFLKNIKEETGNKIQNYFFEYKKNTIDYKDYNTDFWGYYKNDKSEETNQLYKKIITYNGFDTENRNVDIKSVDTDVLNKITYPTGGVNIFQYEPNTYSYIGNNRVENFDNNLENWKFQTLHNLSLYSSNSREERHSLGYITSQKIYLINAFISNNDGIAGFLNLYKRNNHGQIVETVSIIADHSLKEYLLEAGYEYIIGFTWNHLGQIGVDPDPNIPEVGYSEVNISERIKEVNENKWLYGGGIRIKNIFTLDNKEYTLNQNGEPNNYEKKINYNYRFIDNQYMSSGSLVYPEPVLVYDAKRKIMHGSGICNIETFNLIYNVNSRLNNLSTVLTQGSDVGYKNVTKIESGNGKILYSFTSPIDYPEEFNYVNIRYPYLPTSNIDYKRGLVEFEQKYDESNRILTSTSNQYDFEDHLEIIGLSTFYNEYDCPWSSSFKDYEDYNIKTSSSACNNNAVCLNSKIHCGKPSNFILKRSNKVAFGWSKLKSSEEIKYFYNSTYKDSIKNITNYKYNQDNMLIESLSTTTSKGEVLTTEYQYPSDLTTGYSESSKMVGLVNSNRVAEPVIVKQKVDNLYVSEIHNKYAEFNGILQKSAVFQKKGEGINLSLATDRKIVYNSYDTQGNITQYTAENGMPVAIIWGYNGQYPIAKIEGASYSEVSSFVTALQNLSNNGTLEKGSFNDLRMSLTKAMITTYTYQPLIGLTSITGPNGLSEYYKYDEANRLKEILNDKDELLKTFDYHYKK